MLADVVNEATGAVVMVKLVGVAVVVEEDAQEGMLCFVD